MGLVSSAEASMGNLKEDDKERKGGHEPFHLLGEGIRSVRIFKGCKENCSVWCDMLLTAYLCYSLFLATGFITYAKASEEISKARDTNPNDQGSWNSKSTALKLDYCYSIYIGCP